MLRRSLPLMLTALALGCDASASRDTVPRSGSRSGSQPPAGGAEPTCSPWDVTQAWQETSDIAERPDGGAMLVGHDTDGPRLYGFDANGTVDISFEVVLAGTGLESLAPAYIHTDRLVMLDEDRVAVTFGRNVAAVRLSSQEVLWTSSTDVQGLPGLPTDDPYTINTWGLERSPSGALIATGRSPFTRLGAPVWSVIQRLDPDTGETVWGRAYDSTDGANAIGVSRVRDDDVLAAMYGNSAPYFARLRRYALEDGTPLPDFQELDDDLYQGVSSMATRSDSVLMTCAGHGWNDARRGLLLQRLDPSGTVFWSRMFADTESLGCADAVFDMHDTFWALSGSSYLEVPTSGPVARHAIPSSNGMVRGADHSLFFFTDAEDGTTVRKRCLD